MKKRSSFPKKKSKRDFKRKSGVHPKNSIPASLTQRGGFRL